MTLKQLVYKILLENKETRDSDKKLIWEVWTKLELTDFSFPEGEHIHYGVFLRAPSPESIRRCRQALQRTDLLSGAKLIQPTKTVKEKRVKLSKEKGYSYQQGREPTFNPLTQTYEY